MAKPHQTHSTTNVGTRTGWHLRPISRAHPRNTASMAGSGKLRKGKATEALIASMCVLSSGGELNPLTALVDDEGVDLGLWRRGGRRVLSVQIKSRFSDPDGCQILRTHGQYMADVRLETFTPRPDLHMLFVVM